MDKLRDPRSLTSIDASALLEQLVATNHDLGGSDFIRDVHTFLRTPTGSLRVELDRESLDDQEIV